MFTLEVIDQYYGLTQENIIPVPIEQDMVLIVQMPYKGQENVGEEFEYKKLTHSLQC